MLVRTTFVNSVGISTRSSNSSRHKLLYHVGPRWILPCSWGHLTAVIKVVTVVYCRIIHNHSIPNSIKTKNRQKKHRHHGRLCLVICVMCSSFLHSPNITFPQDYHTYSFKPKHSRRFLRFLRFRSKAPRLSPRHQSHPARTLEHSRHTVARSCERIPRVPSSMTWNTVTSVTDITPNCGSGGQSFRNDLISFYFRKLEVVDILWIFNNFYDLPTWDLPRTSLTALVVSREGLSLLYTLIFDP